MLSQTRPNHAKHSHIVLIVFFSDYEIVKLQNLKAQVELLQSLNIDQEKNEILSPTYKKLKSKVVKAPISIPTRKSLRLEQSGRRVYYDEDKGKFKLV